MECRELAQRLNSVKYLRSKEEVKIFDRTLEALSDLSNVDCLDEILLVFDDNTEQHEVMFGLVHFVESIGLSCELKMIFTTLPCLVVRAKEWTRILLMRILNGNESYAMLLRLLHGDGLTSLVGDQSLTVKSILLDLMIAIQDRAEKTSRVGEVIKLLASKGEIVN